MVRLHAQASAWFAENGLIEEALKHALAGENLKAAARLIVTHGFDLMNDEQWPRLERWLRMLTGNVIDEDPELLLLISWLHMIYARFAELMPCLNKAEALFSARAIAGPKGKRGKGKRGVRSFILTFHSSLILFVKFKDLTPSSLTPSSCDPFI